MKLRGELGIEPRGNQAKIFGSREIDGDPSVASTDEVAGPTGRNRASPAEPRVGGALAQQSGGIDPLEGRHSRGLAASIEQRRRIPDRGRCDECR